MSDVRTTTNHHHREILDSSALTSEEQREFDHYDWVALENGDDSAYFFRFRGQLWALDDFVRVTSEESPGFGWDAGMATSAWDAVVIRYVQNCPDHSDDCIIVGHQTW